MFEIQAFESNSPSSTCNITTTLNLKLITNKVVRYQWSKLTKAQEVQMNIITMRNQ
jgi:hypothetical protein